MAEAWITFHGMECKMVDDGYGVSMKIPVSGTLLRVEESLAKAMVHSSIRNRVYFFLQQEEAFDFLRENGPCVSKMDRNEREALSYALGALLKRKETEE